MRIAILTESSADDAAVRIFAEAILGEKTEPVEFPIRARGWSSLQPLLPSLIRKLHYHSNADGLVVVVDSNGTSVVETGPKNRLQSLCILIETVTNGLTPVSGRTALKTAVGVASPAMEAWLLCKRFPNFNEGNWESGLKIKRDPYSKLELKKLLYGTERPSLDPETRKMVEAARELSSDLQFLRKQFPKGFGSLHDQLTQWR